MTEAPDLGAPDPDDPDLDDPDPDPDDLDDLDDPDPEAVEAVAAAVRAVLGNGAVWTTDDLVDALMAAGTDLGDDPEDLLLYAVESDAMAMVAAVGDDGWALLPALLADRVFTHRLRAAEVEHDLIDMDPDLLGVDRVTDDVAHRGLPDGRTVEPVLTFPSLGDEPTPSVIARGVPAQDLPENALLLPPGLLAEVGVTAGDLIGVRLGRDGWQFLPVPEEQVEGSGQRLADALRRVVDRLAHDSPIEVGEAVWQACADDPNLFRTPLAPLGDALAASGLSRYGDMIATAGFDFAGWRSVLLAMSLTARYDLSGPSAMIAGTAVLAVQRAVAQSADADAAADAPSAEADAGVEADVAALMPALLAPEVANVVATELCQTRPDGPETLIAFTQRYERLVPRQARVALEWLRGKALEYRGDAAAAERQFEAARSLDPLWPPLLVDLASYAADRGDADRALTLLGPVGLPDDHYLVAPLLRFRAPQRPDLGRNRPCWCGSGRKYKQCHLGRELLPLDERGTWLYQKAARYAVAGRWQPQINRLVAVTVGESDDTVDVDTVLGDPAVMDVLLMEGGALAAFLAERGYLLPDDERLLATQWLLTGRSVFEIEEVRHGEGMTVRDLRTGDRLQVQERLGSRGLSAGDLVCMRVAATGEVRHVYGLAPIPATLRDPIIEVLDGDPDAEEVVAALAARFAPPLPQDTDGDPLAGHTTTPWMPDPA